MVRQFFTVITVIKCDDIRGPGMLQESFVEPSYFIAAHQMDSDLKPSGLQQVCEQYGGDPPEQSQVDPACLLSIAEDKDVPVSQGPQGCLFPRCSS